MTDDELRQALEATTRARRLELVLEARRRGWSYGQIGRLIDMTRQSVYGMVLAKAKWTAEIAGDALGVAEPGQPSGLDPDRS
jgi:hypothetical protein